ncbi:MBL fold metallo-hydrolase [Occallatibacter riparius]|uniref:MBL fold metallo-hydrolase n=1 Tax=Occallatibacter riparius TaxID=1002689 RepID=A0A9J7BXU4_9BACT|nr:MBL fold metallo-hydrolase [Occallatibacter riparius]UWZ86818.1 MBL fold metallo-hydrolase [Occallatibacter riparius]
MSEKPPFPVTRRGFLQVAAGALVVPQTAGDAWAAAPPGRSFATSNRPAQLSENLFVLQDTCNVYLVRNGERGLLVDFGSGRILDFLPELGVTQIELILHTHYHRDQAQGDLLANARGIPIAVPAHERHLFEDVERLWANRRVFDLYQVRNEFFSLTQNVPVSKLLHDYETFDWRSYSFFVQPTPGHTIGSITLVAQIDGKRTAFCGDLLFASGKVQNLYDLQYFYGEHEGVDFSLYSVNELIDTKPDLLCPSHGEPIRDPGPAMQQVQAHLLEWYHYWKPTGTPTYQFKSTQVSPHLIAHPLPTSTFYAILSKSGKAMLVDYGSASWNFFQCFRDATDTYGRMRFVEHSLRALQSEHGVSSFDVAVASHIHDDHVNGFAHLARRYGTRIWCYENNREIFRNPRGRNLGCILAEPIEVDRTFQHGERFQWEEYEFTVMHSPGHTEYQMALFTTIDETPVAFTGDAFFSYDKIKLTHNLIYRNDVRVGDYLRSIQNVQEMKPQLIAPGHGEPFKLNDGMIQEFVARAQRQDAIFASLIANPVTNFGLDPAWVQIYPYQAVAVAGQPCALEIRVRNHSPEPLQVEAALVLPAEWLSSQGRLRFMVAAHSVASHPVTITIPRSAYKRGRRRAIAVDVMVNGAHLGQLAEAVVDMSEPDSLRISL